MSEEGVRASSEATSLLEQAAPLVQGGRFRAAIPLLSSAVAADPGSDTARKMLFWTRAAQLRVPLAIGMAVTGLWACVDPGPLGLAALVFALAVLIWFTSIAIRAKRWRRVLTCFVYAVAFVLGHWLLAPLTIT